GSRKTETRQGWDDEMKGIAPIATVSARVRERTNQIKILRDRARPAVGKDQRQGIRLRSPNVEEMNVLAVDGGRELRVGVETGFLGPPVVGCAPVVSQVFHFGEWDAVIPAGVGELVWPAGATESLT